MNAGRIPMLLCLAPDEPIEPPVPTYEETARLCVGLALARNPSLRQCRPALRLAATAVLVEVDGITRAFGGVLAHVPRIIDTEV